MTNFYRIDIRDTDGAPRGLGITATSLKNAFTAAKTFVGLQDTVETDGNITAFSVVQKVDVAGE